MSEVPLKPGQRYFGTRIVWDHQSPEYKIHIAAQKAASSKRHCEKDKARRRAKRLDPEYRQRRSAYYHTYNIANRAHRRETNRQWRLKNRSKINASRAAKRHGTAGDAVREADRRYYHLSERTYLSRRFNQIVEKCSRAAGLNHDKLVRRSISITRQDIENLWYQQAGLCALTGKLMSLRPNGLYSASVDRIDCINGYHPGNVQLVCLGANYAKNRFSNEDVLYFLSHDRAPIQENTKQLTFNWTT